MTSTAASPPLPDSPPRTPPQPVPARWFDGRSSQGRAVLAAIAPGPRGPELTLHPVGTEGGAPEHFAHGAVDWPEAWNPRRPPPRLAVDLGGRGSLEIAGDGIARWHAALQAAGHRAGIAQRMQTRWGMLATVLLASVLVLALFYRYGTPWLATQLTRAVPLGWETSLARETLERMDGDLLRPSRLAPERQQQLRARFDTLVQGMPSAPQRYAGYAPALRLEFRRGMGANAFALPGGTVVITDGLAETASRRGLGDDALAGVLAHEIGHVVYRHTTRTVVEQGVLNIGLGLALGDVSSLLSTGGALVTGLAYSRAHEREADCYALALMGRARLPTAPMADLLLAIAQEQREAPRRGKGPAGDHAKDGREEKDDADGAANQGGEGGTAAKPPEAPGSGPAARETPEAPPREGSGDSAWMGLLATHPGTEQRAAELRAGHAPHCARP
ncbi:M48 family metallopeptidase [Paracidovorax citrulli]|uniref:Peptidase M48, Ste24p n=2 Tax=Paracidovorax citrulli TaxID=80869 RepID=A1TKA0_PARC0|nr:M48 family metallopeptidase [Paracidovorax citrulli]ABM31388.1 peptidase M48, Ste24p [Paracidovorax citrulli AAC00-1]ATG95499.1 peptidase M48 [Paracidovorax citrulli]PVY65575.1 Zn-dependent protease with chaperone function [Paracidovorax citrulli]QCX11310.1 Beta-barrel assembly-enhancing protease [Paracidovorax citrulli]REG70252.1 Zn-dependent protease with chaperone function [Paracidovorax citrulli]